MTGHRDRLIEEGLYKPLPQSEMIERNRLIRRIRAGEKIKDKPINCVIRVDELHNQLFHPDEEHRCKDAELIADSLYSWEAWRLVLHLNAKDKQQPPRPNRFHPPLEMYRICSAEEWDDWLYEHSQQKMIDL